MSDAALKRVEALLALGAPPSFADLRAILALAKDAAELRKRVASIRYIIKRASHDPDTMAIVRDLLDLRKPLPRKAGKR